jgi:hypothetical protein
MAPRQQNQAAAPMPPEAPDPKGLRAETLPPDALRISQPPSRATGAAGHPAHPPPTAGAEG